MVENLKANIPVKYKFQCRLAVSNFLKEGRKSATKQTKLIIQKYTILSGWYPSDRQYHRATPPNNFNNLFSSQLFEFYREKSARLCIFVIRVVRPGLTRRVFIKWSRAINIFFSINILGCCGETWLMKPADKWSVLNTATVSSPIHLHPVYTQSPVYTRYSICSEYTQYTFSQSGLYTVDMHPTWNRAKL